MIASRLVLTLLCLLPAVVLADEPPSPIPSGYSKIWSDEFSALSLRTGGPTWDGLAAGKGTWAAPGATYSADPRGVAGNGYDWFIDPSYYGWSKIGYKGPFTSTPDGLRIRAEHASAAIATMLPSVATFPWARHQLLLRQDDRIPWMSGQVSTAYSVRIAPPFYFEARAKMPVGSGRPWPAIWLITGGDRPGSETNKSYEIDVHEGFADSDQLHATIHVNTAANIHTVVNQPSGVDLSHDFNTWGCTVTKDKQIFFFNGTEVGRLDTPAGANADDRYMIILDVSAGIPWKNGGPPSGGPFDMTVRYVRLYAPDTHGLTLK
jgi:hypothetical protein